MLDKAIHKFLKITKKEAPNSNFRQVSKTNPLLRIRRIEQMNNIQPLEDQSQRWEDDHFRDARKKQVHNYIEIMFR